MIQWRIAADFTIKRYKKLGGVEAFKLPLSPTLVIMHSSN